MSEFNGKSVLVTGGALGIGRATAMAFADAGAAVAVVDIDTESGHNTVAEIEADGGKAHFIRADMGITADCERAIVESVDALEGLDILFNNVGVQPADSYVDAVDLDEAIWDRIIAVNLKSRFLMAKFAIPHMRDRGGGVIIHSASVQGLQSMPGVAAYAASKGGDLSLVRQLAIDFAAENIRVLAICPGTIDTPLVRNASRAGGRQIEAALREYGADHPLGRVGEPEEVANVVLFLASDGASFMTGDYVCVDGGIMALGNWAGGAGAQT